MRNNAVYEGNKRALIAAIVLIALILSASYAFFSSYNNAKAGFKTGLGNALNVTYTLTAGQTFGIEINPSQLGTGNAGQKTSQIAPGADTVTLTNSSSYVNLTCSYEVWYEPTTVFNNSSNNTSGDVEIELVIENLSNPAYSKSIDLNGITAPTKIQSVEISTNEEVRSATHKWTYTLNHYNRAFDQSSHIGKTFGGKVYFKNTGCEEKNSSLNLKDTILADNIAYPDNIKSEFVSNSTGIDFSQPSSNTNGKGLYYTSTNTEGNKPTYYFRGDVQNNYVKFGNTTPVCEYNGTKITQFYKMYTTSDGMAIPPVAETISTKEDCEQLVVCNVNGNYVTADSGGLCTSFLGGTTQTNSATWTDSYIWRIVRINEDGSIRLVLQNSIGDNVYNDSSDSNAYVGYEYGEANGSDYYDTHKPDNDSVIKIFLTDWYNKNINGKYDSTIISSEFCNDKEVYSGTGVGTSYNTEYKGYERYSITYKPQYVCVSNEKNYGDAQEFSSYNIKVGLLTLDELMYAGNISDGGVTYLQNGKDETYWTMTPSRYLSTGSRMFNYSGNSTAINQSRTVSTNVAVRPVINLKSSVEISGGSGTSDDPYVINTGSREFNKAILSDNNASPDNEPSQYVTGANGIDFSQPSSDTNGKGLYYTSTNTEGNKPTYYFRGDVQNNYVKFGDIEGGTCIYNGYDVTTWNHAYVNGMLQPPVFTAPENEFECSEKVLCAPDQSLLSRPYITVETSADCTGLYRGTVINDTAIWKSNSMWRVVRINEDGSVRLISENALGNVGTIDGIYKGGLGYMYGNTSPNDVNFLYENTYNSSVKTYSENWYETNLKTNYHSYIYDAGFCNDRSIASLDIYPDVGDKYVYFGINDRLSSNQPQFGCPQSNDLFTTSTSTKGNKAATYPIGLLTADEAIYAGYDVAYNATSNNYLSSDYYYATLTPYLYEMEEFINIGILYKGGLYFDHADLIENNQFRPVINLKGDLKVTGSGTATDPYVIEGASSDSSGSNSGTAAPSKYTVTVTRSGLSVGSLMPETQEVESGKSATVNISVPTGVIPESNTCGGTISGSTMTIPNVTKDINCTVTLGSDPSVWLFVSGSGAVFDQQGAPVTNANVTVSPNYMTHFGGTASFTYNIGSSNVYYSHTLVMSNTNTALNNPTITHTSTGTNTGTVTLTDVRADMTIVLVFYTRS